MSRVISIPLVNSSQTCFYCNAIATHLIGKKQTPCCQSSVYQCPVIRQKKQPRLITAAENQVCSCGLPALFLIGKDKLPCCQDMTTKCPARIEKAKQRNALRVDDTLEKRMLRKYGVSNPSSLAVFTEKRLATYERHHGTRDAFAAHRPTWDQKYDGHPMKDPKIKEKRIQTNRLRYGADHPMHNPEVRARYRSAYLEFLHNDARQLSWKENQKQAFLKKYGVPHPMMDSVVVQKRTQMWKEKYGGHPLQTMEVYKKWQSSAFRQRLYTLPSGLVIKLRGFEAKVLEHLLNHWGFAEEDFEFNEQKFPEIYYADPKSKRRCRYYPDFFLPHLKWIIEVKSEYTFLEVEDCVFERNLAKRSACLALGYDFSFLLWDPKLECFIEF